MKNLVMGTGKGYSWYNLEPFVRSFLKNVPNADLVLFVDEISDFTRHCFKTFGEGRVKIEPFPEYAKNCRPNNIRWKIFRDYAKIHGAKYKQIFTSDTRDVIFQGDIFGEFAQYESYWAYATESDTIKGEKTEMAFNYQWLTETFGKDEADKLADKEIICDGTVIGTSKEMLIFFEKMVDYIPSFTEGHDQIIQQYLFYNNLLPFKKIIKIDNISGAIFTAGVFYLFNEAEIKDEQILRGNGGVPAVVHQYDRKPEGLKLIDRIYRDKNFQFDGKFVDADSILDQVYHLVDNENWSMLLKVVVIYVLPNLRQLVTKTEYSISDFGNPTRKYSEYLIIMWQKVLQSNKTLAAEAEILELTLQRAIMDSFSDEVKGYQLTAIYKLMMYALQYKHPVSHLLKQFVYSNLVSLANILYQRGDYETAEEYLDKVGEIDFPPNQDFYMAQATVYRQLKKKEEAVEAFKKALEFD